MTTFIPSLTLPAVLFQTPAVAILFPIVLGSAVGYTVSRMSPEIPIYYVYEDPLLRP